MLSFDPLADCSILCAKNVEGVESMEISEHIVVLVTAGTEPEARQIAKSLVEKRLVACVNILPVSSLYMWEDELREDHEVLMVIKSTSEVFREKLLVAIQDAHSYDVPEIIGMPIVLGSPDYLKWISTQVEG
ncbi:MAG TPA: divalent-cation tolerance protein CutA [Aggregatilineales bacterium]|nr:divalent-cation tolerance protein CutA [Aggregatilineales bacterium]